MEIKVTEKIELKLDDKKIVLTREEAKELVKMLQDTLEIPPQVVYQYYPWYPQYPTVSIPSVWTGGDHFTTGTITSSASTLPDGEIITFNMDKGA